MSERKLAGQEILETALQMYSSAYCDQCPPYEDKIDLGREYHLQMKKLVKKSKNPFYKCFNTVGKRVACIAIAALILISCSMTVTAVREPFVEFWSKKYAKFIEYFFGEVDASSAPDTIETVYVFSCVPDGYTVTEFKQTDHETYTIWCDDQNNMLQLYQFTMNCNHPLNYEPTMYSLIEKENNKIVCIRKDKVKEFYWNNDEYAFAFSISNTFTDGECLRIIDSLLDSYYVNEMKQ